MTRAILKHASLTHLTRLNPKLLTFRERDLLTLLRLNHKTLRYLFLNKLTLMRGHWLRIWRYLRSALNFDIFFHISIEDIYQDCCMAHPDKWTTWNDNLYFSITSYEDDDPDFFKERDDIAAGLDRLIARQEEHLQSYEHLAGHECKADGEVDIDP